MSGDTNSKTTVADSVAGTLRRAILSNEYAPGTTLPAERELATSLDVSRLSLRSALSTLEAEGLIAKEHGAGNRVRDFRESGGIEVIGHLMQLSLSGGELPVRLIEQLLEVRRLIAVEVVTLACERSGEDDIRHLRAIVAELHELVTSPRKFMQADLRFAQGMVRATNNLALELLFNTVQRIILGNRGFEAAFMLNASAIVKTYERIVDLLEAGDAEATRRLALRVLERLDGATSAKIRELRDTMDRAKEKKEST